MNYLKGKNRSILIIILLALLILSSCSKQAPSQQSQDNYSAGSPAEMDVADVVDQSDRMIIKTAYLTLVVGDVEKTFNDIMNIVEARKGFIQNSRNWERDEALYVNATLRIPAEDFTYTIDYISSLGKVSDKQIGGQDVTEDFVDKESRLRNLQRQEDRYLEILSEAKTIDDILKLEKELSRIRGEIEVLTGQLASLEHKINYSTIDINIRQEKAAVEVSAPSFKKAFSSAIDGISNSYYFLLTVLAALIVVIGYLIPVLPFIAIGLYIYYRRTRKNSNKGERLK